MRYADLVKFEPIESVVQLISSADKKEATRLVSTFVISDSMVANLSNKVFPQLQFHTPKDNMGLLIVGNYGTGKSHLMSVICAIAEDAEQVNYLTNPAVKEPAKQIAGQFVVIRGEIGSSTDSLRNIVCKMLERGLAEHGINFEFPPQDQIVNNKEPLQEMMSTFHEVFPEKGLLLVVDELLDYLRTRKELELRLDLAFLREMGEVCKTTRFRFMAGVQEQLFNNPTFEFVSGEMRRVQERYTQVLISREDVSFVVSQRLLKKTPTQKAQIREYLNRFARYFGNMTERMDQYVDLFPVHPAYLETFEQVRVAEKREILRTLSEEMSALMDKEVPTDVPGLISFDSYWNRIKANPSYQTDPDIRTVMTRVNVLEEKVRLGISTKLYREPALRIIRALAVHRLTTGDLRVPLGLSAQELRDGLCLLIPGAEDADFLQTLLEKILHDIVTVVDGQFITYNKTNGQYYLDVDRDVDYDQLIQKRAASLEPSTLDRYYFDALVQVMECADITYRPGFRIWEHEIVWRSRGVTRQGYLFFGAPNERPNTVPYRDFYIYFLEPYEPTKYKDEKRPDEIFFRLAHVDDTFTAALRTFAAARELALTATGPAQRVFNNKAIEARMQIVDWLRKNMGTAFEVIYQGKKQLLIERANGHITGSFADVRDMVNAVATVTFEDHFNNLAPDYPAFAVKQPIRKNTRNQACTEALKWLATPTKSALGGAVLEGLRLVENGQVRTANSPYARALLNLLKERGPGKVVNRSEIVTELNQQELWQPFRLEPEFLAVVLGALIYTGEIVVGLPHGQKKLDSGEIERLARMQASELAAFTHIELPRSVPVTELRALFELLGLQPGLVVSETSLEQAVHELQVRVKQLAPQLAKAYSQVAVGLTFWNQPLLSEAEQMEWKKGLKALADFVDGLQAYNTPGKLKNFRYELATILAQKPNLELFHAYQSLTELLDKAQGLVTYLSQAEGTLPSNHPWRQQLKEVRPRLLADLLDPARRGQADFEQSLLNQLRTLKNAYVAAYCEMHQQARLSPSQEAKWKSYLKDARYLQLSALSAINLFPRTEFQALQDELAGMKACIPLTSQDLETTTICPHCQYRPVDEGPVKSIGAVLDRLDERLDALLEKVTRSLLENLNDPTVRGNMSLLSSAEGKAALEFFLSSGKLPDGSLAAFVKAANEVLSGLERVVIKKGSLEQAIFGGSGPLTADELKKRLDKVYADLVKGKPLGQVRFVWE